MTKKMSKKMTEIMSKKKAGTEVGLWGSLQGKKPLDTSYPISTKNSSRFNPYSV